MPEVRPRTWWCMALVLVCLGAPPRVMRLEPPSPWVIWARGATGLLLPGSLGSSLMSIDWRQVEDNAEFACS
jgi:hypothetical protein